VNLVHALVGLHNNYELDDFDVKRQAGLNGLVACCPRKAAP
jgi:telomere length regulation protein